MRTVVKELVDLYEDGILTRLELYSKIVDELTADTADAIISELPPDLRRGFGDWAREFLDNDIPASGFITLKAQPVKDEALSAVRDWLRRHPKEDQV